MEKILSNYKSLLNNLESINIIKPNYLKDEIYKKLR